MEPLLHVKELSTEFVSTDGHVLTLLKDISFRLEKGKILGIVGESGSGKTTLALTILGLLPFKHGRISKGDIVFKGKNLLHQDEEAWSSLRGNKLSIIFQEPFAHFNPSLSVGEQVAEILRLHQSMPYPLARTKTVDLLKRLGIQEAGEKFDTLPGQWSGGQLQRAMIAMALLNGPDVLIADEPTSALDPVTFKEILNLLKEEIKVRGMGLILITHDIPSLENLADDIMVLYGGEMMEYSTGKGFFERPRHPYSLALSSCFNYPEQWNLLPVLDGMSFHFSNSRIGCPFASRCAYKQDQCTQGLPIPRQTISGDSFYQCVLETHE